jgi:hypothetical protein
VLRRHRFLAARELDVGRCGRRSSVGPARPLALRILLPAHETGAAKCFDAQQSPGPGTSTMTVDRSGELVLEGWEPDAAGMPTRLVGRYDEDVTIDEQSADCGFPHEFAGTWEWDLTSLDSSPIQDTA